MVEIRNVEHPTCLVFKETAEKIQEAVQTDQKDATDNLSGQVQSVL
jgi:hypothetical protein